MKPRAAALPSAAKLGAIRRALLAFYAAHARDLPWRRTRDPYAIWVSEIMLQQTRVETVLRYYEPFLKRFPDVRALAEAEQDAVLAAWSGLGYYRRARMLHAGVREVVARYGGVVPDGDEARRSLPGIGRYTAGAIGSIAFAREEALVDGNVARVFARLFGIDTPLGQRDTDARLWALAEALVVGPEPGALNQALMELGATLCSKAAPSCSRCPIGEHCVALKEQRVHELPRVRKKRAPKPVALVAVVAFDAPRERVLLVRSDEALFGGLWNLPMREGEGHLLAAQLLRDLGVNARVEAVSLGRIEHVLTHRRMQLQLYAAEVQALAQAEHVRLQPRARLAELGVSSLTTKTLAAAERDRLPLFAYANAGVAERLRT
ncbi:MAG TPA: A/G-specific adenine glycosylase [Polyangiales bacterium]